MIKYFLILMVLIVHLGTNTTGKKILIYGGKTGWIGQQLMQIFQEQGYEAIASQTRLENRETIEKEIQDICPDCVINAAGVTGRPNVDSCEDHKQETIRANIIGALTLADLTWIKRIQLINIGTGCIYEYDSKHPMYSGIGFTEKEEPNFQGSFYSYTKIPVDRLLCTYPNVLNLRLRMPISDDLHPRNFITKITRYKKVVNIPNSMSILSDLLPLIPEMVERKLTGVFNFVNPGVISHNEILELYKQYVDPNFVYENFTIEEQNKILKAGRSNNHLDAGKLLHIFPGIPTIQESIIHVFEKMQKNVKSSQK